MTELLEHARQLLAAKPFSSLMGAQVASVMPGEVVLHLLLRQDHTQQHYLVNGVLSYPADNALTFAGGSVLGEAVTAEFKNSFLRPARRHALEAKASLVNAGKVGAVCQGVVEAHFDSGSEAVGPVQGTIVRVERAEQ